MPIIDINRRRGLLVALLYGVGEMPITMLMVLFGLFALFFYNSIMGLPATLVGIGVSAGLVLDALLDPYIGHLSDRCTHRLGRRHVFMLPGAMLMGPCLALLFSPPRGWTRGPLFVWLVVCSLSLRAASAVYRIPYLSFGAELAQDYDQRTRIMGIRAAFGLMGTLAAAGLSFLLFFPDAGAAAKLRYAGYSRMGVAFGALMSLAGLASTLGTLGCRTFGSPDSASAARRFFAGFRMSMRQASFRCVWFSFTLFFLAMVLNASLSIQYFTGRAGISDHRALSGIQTSFYVGSLAGVCAWMALARRAEKRTLFTISMLGTAALLCPAAFLFGPGRLLGTGNALPLIAGHALGGILASAVWVMPASMLADVGDADALETGLRREGIYFGILNFGEKTAAGGALLLNGTLLSLAGPAHIGLLYGVVPGALLALAAWLLRHYPLTRARVAEIQARLSGAPAEQVHA